MFDARKGCWRADDGRVYLGSAQAIVGDDDAAYLAWREAYGPPTPWPRDDAGRQTDKALQAVLAPYDLWVDLAAYAADARYRRETGGVTVAGIAVPTDRASQQMIAGMLASAQLDPAVVIKFKAPDGFVTLDATAVISLARAVGAHVQAAFTAEAAILDRIASGKIASIAQIDAAFAEIAG